jgi:hypothetical protein
MRIDETARRSGRAMRGPRGSALVYHTPCDAGSVLVGTVGTLVDTSLRDPGPWCCADDAGTSLTSAVVGRDGGPRRHRPPAVAPTAAW